MENLNNAAMERPLIKNEITPTIARMLEGYLDDIKENGSADDDFEHFLFEEIMEEVYGEDVWNWVNKQYK